MDRQWVRVLIRGRVQGVGYRAWCSRRAAALRLSGWVRNRGDGDVEACFVGDPAAIELMLEACRTGPRGARVRSVEAIAGAEPAEGPFEIRPTV